MSKQNDPLYEHYCRHDIYLGTFEEEGLPTADLHICTKSLLGMSLIARYSSDGPDYESFPVCIFERDPENVSDALQEAYRRSEKIREKHEV